MKLHISLSKFEISHPELLAIIQDFGVNRLKALEKLSEGMRACVASLVSDLLKAEMALFLGRPDQADNKGNGSYSRVYAFKGLGTVGFRMPTDRKGRYQSAVIPKHERTDPRVVEDLASLHLGGISTRLLSRMSQRILGIEVSPKTVSSALPQMAANAEAWLQRPLTQKYWALLVDGSFFPVRRMGSVEKEPYLVVLGIDGRNRRSILALEPGHRDHKDCWRAVFRELKARGLDGDAVQIGVMDGLPGLEEVFREEFPQSVTGRCWFHALQRAVAKLPKRLTEAFMVLSKRVMLAQGEEEARAAFKALQEAMGKDGARGVACLEKDLEALLAHYRFAAGMWSALRTTNGVERIHREVKRRSKSMDALGETSLRTLVAFTAVRMEMMWQTRALDSYARGPRGRHREEQDLLWGSLDTGKSGIESSCMTNPLEKPPSPPGPVVS